MKQTILLVYDEPDAEQIFRQHFRREIRNKVYQFCFARSGPEALDFLGGHDPDDMIVVLSDINMPVMNGLELLRATKSINPELPVVMVTANGDRETERLAREGGALSLLTKPVDFGQLREKLNELAGGR